MIRYKNSVIPNLIECESMNRLRFTSFIFNDDSMLKIIRALDVNKTHGHDDIAIRVIMLYEKSIILPLSLIYKITSTYAVPVHKKGDNQVVDNFRAVSVLPIFGKILERLICNSLFEFIHENNLLNENQLGFRPSDSCEYQLISFVHDIYASFDCNPLLDVKGIFLDISRAFDRVWHEELYKVNLIDITSLPLELIQSFLSHRFQRAVLNGQSSTQYWLLLESHKVVF